MRQEKVRIKFQKYGPIRFVGHLDVMRYFQKVMRRADVDIAYSEGYSPHQLMSFAQPLSVGATSDGEYLDITLRVDETAGKKTDEEIREDLIVRLNRVCREGISVLDAQVLPEKAEKAMTLVSACLWRASFRDEVCFADGDPGTCEPPADLEARFADYLKGAHLFAKKKSKKGEVQMDMKPFVYQASAEDHAFTLLLKSGSEDNVKPALFLGAFLHACYDMPDALFLSGDELAPACMQLHRIETYRMEEDAKGRFLLPLIARVDTPKIRL